MKLAGEPGYPWICACKTVTTTATSSSRASSKTTCGTTPAICRRGPSRVLNAFRLGRLRSDEIHERRGEAIVRLELELSQPRPDRAHVIGIRARLDDRRNEGRELWRRPARFARALGVNEIESVQRVALVVDPAVHVDAALLARVPLDGRLGIHDCELVAVRFDAQVVARDDGDLREQRSFRLPALGAAAHVIVCALTLDRYLDLVLRAVAKQRSACEILCCWLQSCVDRGVNLDVAHGDLSF